MFCSVEYTSVDIEVDIVQTLIFMIAHERLNIIIYFIIQALKKLLNIQTLLILKPVL